MRGKMEKRNDTISTKYVDVLDGIRAISVIIVLIFHFWQQTWIFPTIKTPFLSFIGIKMIDFTPFARVGYLFVDMMILISGFLLFLPVARNIWLGEPLAKWKDFFKKRAIRILPSYLFCIFAIFVYELIAGGFGKPVNAGVAFRDLILHLLFMHTWTMPTYLNTKLNVVLWTLAIEVWFYILFPLFASFIKRRSKEDKPTGSLIRSAVLALVLTGISFFYIYGYVLKSGSPISDSIDAAFAFVGSGIKSSYLAMVINQLPAFFGTYSVGMIGALIYVFAASRMKRKLWSGLLFTAVCIAAIWLMTRMIKQCASLDPSSAQVWQMTKRLPLALVFMLIILSASFSVGCFRFLFANKLMRFLAGISYNLYIWHQWLCVKLKNEWRLPAWEGDTPPNQWGNETGTIWSRYYALVITLFAFGAAILATYLIEKPAAKLLNGKLPDIDKKISKNSKTPKNKPVQKSSR